MPREDSIDWRGSDRKQAAWAIPFVTAWLRWTDDHVKDKDIVERTKKIIAHGAEDGVCHLSGSTIDFELRLARKFRTQAQQKELDEEKQRKQKEHEAEESDQRQREAEALMREAGLTEKVVYTRKTPKAKVKPGEQLELPAV